MAKKNEVTVEDKLRALYDLQLIDSRVDEIRNVRGELPLEVEDLENEIAGLEKRMDNFNQEVSDFDFQTNEQKNNIEVAKEEHKKYEEKVAPMLSSRESGFPVMEVFQDKVWLTWTIIDSVSQLKNIQVGVLESI